MYCKCESDKIEQRAKTEYLFLATRTCTVSKSPRSLVDQINISSLEQFKSVAPRNHAFDAFDGFNDFLSSNGL